MAGVGFDRCVIITSTFAAAAALKRPARSRRSGSVGGGRELSKRCVCVCLGLPVRHFFFESLLAVRKQTVHCIASTAPHFCVSVCFFSVAIACSNIGTVFSIINACGNYQAQFEPKRNDALFCPLCNAEPHRAGPTGDCNQHLHAKYLH